MNRFYESTEIVENYLKYRPIYTNEIPERVFQFYQDHNPDKKKIDLMVDVGCGSGQTADIFQSYCNKLIAYDVSAEQLKQAKLLNKHDHVQFRVGQAEKIDLDDHSVDLIVAGTCAHWFDIPKFFQEAKRLLRPSGCLTIFSYRMPLISLLNNGNPRMAQDGTYLLHSLLGYGSGENPAILTAQVSIENHYDDLLQALPFETKKRINDIRVTSEASINDVCGYIRSVNIWEVYAQRRAEDLKSANIPATQEITDLFDLATRFKVLIKRLWNLNGVGDDEKIFKFEHPFTVLLAKA